MTRYELFDSVKLRQPIKLADGQVVPAGARGAIVELFQGGEAYLVELFGDWVKAGDNGNLVTADPQDPESFKETIGLATVTPQQLELLETAVKTVGSRTHLLAVVDDLSEDMLTEVVDFAEFLRQKHRKELA